jgi:hypothetical protein
MPAAEVIRAGREQGVELTSTQVSTIRSRYKGRTDERPSHARVPSSSPARVVASRAAPGQYRSASDFVRDQPMDQPTKDVIAAGTRFGLKVTPELVRIVRFKMRHADPLTARIPVRRGRPPSTPSPAAVSVTEIHFRRLVLELGTARAMALVESTEAAMKRLIGG